MKKLTDYTTTELLLIAYQEKESIYNKNIYNELLKEAKKQNYENVIEFAEDLRFKKMIEIYKEKKKMQMNILENYNLRNKENQSNNENNFSNTELISFKRSTKKNKKKKIPTFAFKIKNEQIMNQIIPHNQNKQTKIFYKQMSNEEKEIDDFLDKLDEQNLKKRKSKNLVREFQTTQKDVFNFIVDKIFNKKGLRDKHLWPSEFLVILEKLKTELKIDVEKKDNVLIQNCLNCLMKIQQKIFDNDEFEKAVFFKKLLIAFFDFYKK